MATDYLKGIVGLGRAQFSEQIETNIIQYLSWGFLTVGGYVNVYIPQSGVYGGNHHRLRPAKDKNFTDGQVWETFRSDLVWESGINLQTTHSQPIGISGVWINNTFYPSNITGAFSHYIDYPNGRVIFNNAISQSSTVSLSYSYRYIQVQSVDSPVFRDLMAGSFRADNSTFGQAASGAWVQHPSTRPQYPCIFVEVMSNKNYTPLQLGGGQIVNQTIFFHVFAEQSSTRNKLVDALANQSKSTLLLFDKNAVADANAFPLTASGNLSSNPKTYRDLIKESSQGGYQYNKAYIFSASAKNVNSTLPVYRGQVRWDIQVELSNI